MDVFLEHLVKRKGTAKDTVLRILIVLGVIVFSLAMLMLCLVLSAFAFIFLCLIAGAIYGAWFLMCRLSIEYEYIVTNGEMDVDKIMGRQKRKRLVTVSFREMEIMAPVNGGHKRDFENHSVEKTIDAAANEDGTGSYFIITRHAKLGMLRLIFTPDERILTAAKAVAPRKVFTD